MDREAFLTEAYRQRVTPETVLAQAIAADTPVILISESHAEHGDEFYEWMLRTVKEKKPELDCVFIEQPHVLQAAFDACNDGRGCELSALPSFSGIRPALKLGLKVVAVDAVPKVTPGFFSSRTYSSDELLKDVNDRNEFMAGTAENLLKTKCHAAVMIIGAFHGHRDPRLKSIPEHLAEKNVRNFRIELFTPALNTSGQPDRRWFWANANGGSACPRQPGSVGRNFGFFTKGIDANAVSSYGPFSDLSGRQLELVGTWKDNDAAIAIGCRDPQAATCKPFGDGAKSSPGNRFLNAD